MPAMTPPREASKWRTPAARADRKEGHEEHEERVHTHGPPHASGVHAKQEPTPARLRTSAATATRPERKECGIPAR
eukprot:15454853-Alexandrium_andersonii.AAC.1